MKYPPELIEGDSIPAWRCMWGCSGSYDESLKNVKDIKTVQSNTEESKNNYQYN